jgi:flavin reductase (DIM6/NTAB) family NADH-FMN oxidoreductase RutF
MLQEVLTMAKVTMGPLAWVHPTPAFLVGANVEGRPNFMTVAWGGIANSEPPMISVALRHQRYTYKGLRQNMTFSVNIPSLEQVREVDHCGMVSGAKEDKVKVCGFQIFYGKLGNAPLIEQCPVNLECKVLHILDLGTHALCIGRIEEIHISAECLTEGKPDLAKISPLMYAPDPTRRYYTYGESPGAAFSIGKEISG